MTKDITTLDDKNVCFDVITDRPPFLRTRSEWSKTVPQDARISPWSSLIS